MRVSGLSFGDPVGPRSTTLGPDATTGGLVVAPVQEAPNGPACLRPAILSPHEATE